MSRKVGEEDSSREVGEEDSLLQLPEARTFHYRLPGDKEQTLNLQEAIQE